MELPTRRNDVRGRDLEGRSVVLTFSISKKLYRCPGCGGSIEIGREHVIVRYPDDGYYQHWHAECARSVLRELRGAERIPTNGS